MGLLDAMFGLPQEATPKPKKKRHDDEDRHRRQRRHSSSHGDKRRSVVDDGRRSKAEVTKPASSEKQEELEALRRKRTEYLSKPIEEHRNDIDNQRRKREAEDAERAASSHPREDIKERSSGPSKPRRESKRKSTDKGKGRVEERAGDTDVNGYEYVYGSPPPRRPHHGEESEVDRTGEWLAALDISDPHKSRRRGTSGLNDWSDNHYRDRSPAPHSRRRNHSNGDRDSVREKRKDRPDKVSVTPGGYVRPSRKSSADISRKDPPRAPRPALERSRTTGRLHTDTSRTSRLDGRASVISGGNSVVDDDLTRPRASQTSGSVNKVKIKSTSDEASASRDRSSVTRPAQTRRTSTLQPISEDPGLKSPKTSTEQPKRARSSSLPAPYTVNCSICIDDFPISQVEALPCTHTWCHGCLKRTFYFTPEGTVIGTQPMCCNTALKKDIATRVLTPNERKKWDRKVSELADKKPIYCPTNSCNSRWISKEHYYAFARYALCTKCKTKVCLKCKQPYHGDKRCPKNNGDKEMAQLAKDEGYQRCKNCKIFVERTEGCSHMSCKCGNHFCYVCGENYITPHRPACSCPIYDRDPDQDDLLDEAFARRHQRHFVDLVRDEWLGRERVARWDEFVEDDDIWGVPEPRRGHDNLVGLFEAPRPRERGRARDDGDVVAFGGGGDRHRVRGYEQNLFLERDRDHGRRHDDLWEDDFEYG